MDGVAGCFWVLFRTSRFWEYLRNRNAVKFNSPLGVWLKEQRARFFRVSGLMSIFFLYLFCISFFFLYLLPFYLHGILTLGYSFSPQFFNFRWERTYSILRIRIHIVMDSSSFRNFLSHCHISRLNGRGQFSPIGVR